MAVTALATLAGSALAGTPGGGAEDRTAGLEVTDHENPIPRENARHGSTRWEMPDAEPGSIEGYASELSVLPGETLHLHVSTQPAARYRVEIYRLGWYRGRGARRVACLPGCRKSSLGAPQPVPPPDPVTGEIRADWPVTDKLPIRTRWVSGYYVAKLVLKSGQGAWTAATVPFIVRESLDRHSTVLVQSSVNTVQAYNNWGGKSLYAFNSTDRIPAKKVSFDRPQGGGQTLFNWEYPLVRYLEREGVDVSYTTDADTDRDPGSLLQDRLVMTAGHDEYWTRSMRDAFEAARDSGVNLAFMGANNGYWQIRYENDRRSIAEYRLTALDPLVDPSLKTVRFRDLVPARPECALSGVEFQGGQRLPGDPPRDYAPNSDLLGDPWFAGTGLTAGSLLRDIVGYEWDSLKPGCLDPEPTVLFRYDGDPVGACAVRYVTRSGGRVFSSGTMSFSWGLDGWGGHEAVESPALQQFMREALADLTKPPVAARTDSR